MAEEHSPHCACAGQQASLRSDEFERQLLVSMSAERPSYYAGCRRPTQCGSATATCTRGCCWSSCARGAWRSHSSVRRRTGRCARWAPGPRHPTSAAAGAHLPEPPQVPAGCGGRMHGSRATPGLLTKLRQGRLSMLVPLASSQSASSCRGPEPRRDSAGLA